MRGVLELSRQVASTDTSLLITGETGAGKEWLARGIHKAGPRADGPFVAVHCGALPEPLFESEVFGHVKGAFTGASSERRGCFQLADGGTLLLDEIGDVPPTLQSKLLRALQENHVQPVGSDRQVPVDVRIIAATNQDLTKAMTERRFRPDLYYRLGVVSLHMPALRERREDIARIVVGELYRFAREFGRPVEAVSSDALALLEANDWPGNVRELVNVVERAVLVCRGSVLNVEDLPPEIRVGVESTLVSRTPLHLPFATARDRVVREFEIAYLTGLLERCGGRLGAAAERAGIAPRTLYNKMLEHGLRKEDFRGGGLPAGNGSSRSDEDDPS